MFFRGFVQASGHCKKLELWFREIVMFSLCDWKSRFLEKSLVETKLKQLLVLTGFFYTKFQSTETVKDIL